MKILVHGNAPTTPTGYGVQCALLVDRLVADGHDVAVSCTYGNQATPRIWRDKVKLYPSGYDTQGNDILHNHALHHFEGNPAGGWIIVLTDLWTMTNPLLEKFNVVGWCPVDHFPVPPHVLSFFRRNPEAIPVAMSDSGERLLRDVGLDPEFIPLSVDTEAFKPTPGGREMIGVPDDKFLVGMVAMNKDPMDRKGFNEAFRAFGVFAEDHPDAILYVHADPNGMGTGLHLRDLAVHAGIAEHQIMFPAPYDIQCGSFTTERMAMLYSAFDVLLAPSRGEGFCVPQVEAQACGVPVIVTDFLAQRDQFGAGWLVTGQPWWDHSQRASYVLPNIAHVVKCLNAAFVAGDLSDKARSFAVDNYDADIVYERHWRPFLKSLEPAPPPELDRRRMERVDVIIPAMKRPQNVEPLVASLQYAQASLASNVMADIHFVCDPDDTAQIEAVKTAGLEPIISDRGHTFAQKVNAGYQNTDADWIFVCGDDVRFSPDWLEAPMGLSERYDVIGTNDAADGNGNQRVQSGEHADHFFIRRSYIDEYGASLDGPGTVCHEGYNHFFVDMEIVELAKARNVWTPCLDSIVDHLHPGLGKGQGDLIYQQFDSDNAQADTKTYESRLPLIKMQRQGRTA